MIKRLYFWVFLWIVGLAGGGNVFGLETNHLQSLAVDPRTGVLVMGTHHGLYESRDEGKSWKQRALRGGAPGNDFMTLAVDPAHPNLMYAAGHDLSVIKSEDGGVTWRLGSKRVTHSGCPCAGARSDKA